MVHPEAASDRIETSLAEWQCLGVRDAKARVLVQASRDRRHPGREVDTERLRAAFRAGPGDVARSTRGLEQLGPDARANRVEQRLDRLASEASEARVVSLWQIHPSVSLEGVVGPRIARSDVLRARHDCVLSCSMFDDGGG